jgi:hypothetical protein
MLLKIQRALREVRQGDALHLLSYWTSAPAAVEVHLVDGKGVPVLTRDARLPAATALTDGRALVPIRVTVPATVPPGDYRLKLAVSGSSREMAAGSLRVLSRMVPAQAIDVFERKEALFGGRIKLLGYRFGEAGNAGSVEPGSVLPVTLYWEALEEGDISYTVFVHVLGEAFNPAKGNRLWGQSDSIPVRGSFPTTAWAPGQRVADEHLVPVDDRIPAGEYEIEVGLYDPATGQRLAIESGDDRVVLAVLRAR